MMLRNTCTEMAQVLQGPMHQNLQPTYPEITTIRSVSLLVSQGKY